MPSKRATETATGGDFAASTVPVFANTGGSGASSSSGGSTTEYADSRVDVGVVSSADEGTTPPSSRVFSPSSRRILLAASFSAATRATARAIAEHVRRILPRGSARRASAAASSAAETSPSSGSFRGVRREAPGGPSAPNEAPDEAPFVIIARARRARSRDGPVNKPRFDPTATGSSSSFSFSKFARSSRAASSASGAGVGRRAYGAPGAVQSPPSRHSRISATTSGSSTSRTNASACFRNRGHARSTITFKSTLCRAATAAAIAKRRASNARAKKGSTSARGATFSRLPRGIWSTTSTVPGGAATTRAPCSMRRVRLSMPRPASAGRIAARMETCMRSF